MLQDLGRLSGALGGGAQTASQVLGLKLLVIAEIGALALSVVLAIISGGLLAGLSLAAREACKRAIGYALDELVSKLLME